LIIKEDQKIEYESVKIWSRSKYIPVYEKGSLIGISITVEDITKEKLMEEEQARFQHEILTLSNKREEFINVASHELKTPLSSLKASVQIIEKLLKDAPEHGNVDVKPFLTKANTSITKLSRLISDLLNVNKIERGELILDKSVFVIAELVNSCCDHVRMDGIHEIIVTGDMELTVSADMNKIDQVLVNLINNAVKYAPKSKIIRINVESLPGFAKVSVTDTGPGIPKDKVKNIFKRYYRADSQNEHHSGMGLGLYIAEEIIRRHNGELGVETSLGNGATFWFTLPE
jgi:signal transduction histidine kinase